MKRIAVETIIVSREYLVDISDGETEAATLYRVARQSEGVSLIPNSEKFIASQSLALRDLKPGEDEDFVLVRMEQHREPTQSEESGERRKRGRPRKTGVDTEQSSGIMDETEQDKLDAINSLL